MLAVLADGGLVGAGGVVGVVFAAHLFVVAVCWLGPGGGAIRG